MNAPAGVKIFEGEPLTLCHAMLYDYALYYPPGSDNPHEYASLGYNFFVFNIHNQPLMSQQVKDRDDAIEAWHDYTERHLIHWNRNLADYVESMEANDHKRPVIKGRYYSIAEDSPKPGPGDGFSGCRFEIVFDDGTEVITHNLWYGGEIPPGYLNVIQNNAKFKEGTIAHKLKWNEDSDGSTKEDSGRI